MALGPASNADSILLGHSPQVIREIRLVPAEAQLVVGETLQLEVEGLSPDGAWEPMDPETRLEFEVIVTEGVVTVTEDGWVTAMQRGSGYIRVTYQGLGTTTRSASLRISVRNPGDTDDDGLPDSYEILHGFDPLVPGDGEIDLDRDGLVNLIELARGTDPKEGDTDGDGRWDLMEIVEGTDPLVPDPPEPQPPLEIDETCTLSVLNRAVRARADGTWVLPNVPTNLGRVRVRATCERDGQTASGESPLIEVPPNGIAEVADFDFSASTPVPQSLDLTSPVTELSSLGETAQLQTEALLPDGSREDRTLAADGTSYTTSNPAIATVSEDGLVAAVASGRVLLSAANDGALGMVSLTVTLSGDTDGDGLPDDFELANGLDPNDPADALLDPDGDGLSTLEEFQAGLDPFDGDTDDDGLLDGEEVNGVGTNPLLFDTDGDGLSDGLEVATGSDPLDPSSFNLAAALDSLEVAPSAFTIIFNTVLGEASRGLTVTGNLIDGTSLDLTSSFYGTGYDSTDLTVASFGAEAGRVFAGQDGSATVTVMVGGFAAQAEVTVTSFTPVALSYLDLEGSPLAVAVEGGYAYVAMGAAGLKIVDVSDPEAPFVARRISPRTPPPFSDSQFVADVALQGTVAYMAAGGLAIWEVGDPFAAEQLSLLTVTGAGAATAVAMRGDRAYVGGQDGLAVIDVTDRTAPLVLGSVVTPAAVEDVALLDDVVLVSTLFDGLQVIDLSDEANPAIVGTTGLRSDGSSRAGGMAVAGRRALVADGAGGWTLGGLKVVDVGNPAEPYVEAKTGNAFGLTAVAWDGLLALASDYFYVNAVPIFQLTDGAPLLRAVLDFSGPPSFRDDNGVDLAVAGGLVYMVGQESRFGGPGGLHIGRYLVPFDGAGVPPRVEIVSPADGTPVPERDRVAVEVAATDDVFVESVRFLVDGEVVRTDVAPPFSAALTVPAGVASVEIQAVARDAGGNESASVPVVLPVTPNSAPVVRLLTPQDGESLRLPASLSIQAEATDDVAVERVEFFVDGVLEGTDTSPPYRTSLFLAAGGPQVKITATAYDDVGSASALAILTVQPDAPPQVWILEPDHGSQVVESTEIELVAGALDDLGVDEVRFYVDGSLVGVDSSGPEYRDFFTVLAAGASFDVSAVARDTAGQETTSAVTTVTSVADPLTSLAGLTVNPEGDPVAAATVVVTTDDGTETQGLSDLGGTFLVEGIPTNEGDLLVEASAMVGGEDYVGVLEGLVIPNPGGTVDVGLLTLRPFINSTTLVGRVEDDLGTPVAGALVRVHNRYEKLETVTEADGSFLFEQVPISTRDAHGGSPFIRLYLSAFSGTALRAKPAFPLFPVLDGTTDAGTLVLGPVPGPDPGTTAVGEVWLEENGPIEGALVAVSTDYDLLTTASGADGSFGLGAPALDGPLFATAEALVEGELVTVQAGGETAPVPAGTTDLGRLEFPDGGGGGGG